MFCTCMVFIANSVELFFWNPNWFGVKILCLERKSSSLLNIILSKYLLIMGRRVIGRWLKVSNNESPLWTSVIFAIFKASGKIPSCIHLLNMSVRISVSEGPANLKFFADIPNISAPLFESNVLYYLVNFMRCYFC